MLESFSPYWGTRGIYLDLETFNSTIHHNVVWNLTGSDHNYSLSAGSPRGSERVYNNTFMGKVDLSDVGSGSIDARNNIFAGSPQLNIARQSNNLFSHTQINFATPASKSSLHPNFVPQNITALESRRDNSRNYQRLSRKSPRYWCLRTRCCCLETWL